MPHTPDRGCWGHPTTPLLLRAYAGGDRRSERDSYGHLQFVVQGSLFSTVKEIERFGAWVVSRPTPRSALTIQYITGGSFAVLTRNQKPDLNRSIPMSCCSELGEQPGWGHHFNEDALTESYKAVPKLCWVKMKGQGNKSWI